jgi:Sec-independent protein translocase protein TatA
MGQNVLVLGKGKVEKLCSNLGKAFGDFRKVLSELLSLQLEMKAFDE